MLKHLLCAPTVALLLAIAAPPAFGQKIYWAGTDTINRADLDGSNIETLVTGAMTPYALALDLTGEKVYWSELSGNRLKRANLDGSNVETIAQGAQFRALAVDAQGGKLYRVEGAPGRIVRCGLDGSGAQVIVAGLSDPWGLDLAGSKLYWSDGTLIRRADLDGSQIQHLFEVHTRVRNLAVDAPAGRIYLTDFYQFLISATLEGDQITYIFPVVLELMDVDVDPVAGDVYFSSQDGIRTLEGLILATQAQGIALDLRECSGHGQRVEGACACDPLWQGDNCACYLGGCLNDCSGQGNCVCGFCHCDEAWSGEDCTCSTICPEDCSGHGTCACGTCACDPQYGGEDCSCFTGGCPNDCSGHGQCDCGQCICDPEWDGLDCSCEPQDCLNDCSGHGACNCGVCDCDPGWIEADCSILTQSPRRLFMMPDGLQETAAPIGPTTYLTPAGTTVPLKIWLEDVTSQGGQLHAYQLIMHWDPEPLPGAIGTIEYVNHLQPSGWDSIFLDALRPDWVFSGTIPLQVYYNESPSAHPPIFGLFYETVPGVFVNPAKLGGIHYLCEFKLQVSPDASGIFEYRFNLAPDPGPLSVLFNLNGGPVGDGEWTFQPLRLIIGQTQPLTSEPPHQGIDPRQGSADGPEGGATLELIYNGAAPDASMKHFAVEATAGQPPQIADLAIQGSSVKLIFDRPFPGGQCTTIRHLPSDWHATIRSLPGDVNGDGLTSPLDIIALVDHFNGVKQPALKTWQCDINLSGECEPRDILALVDLLNGGGVQESWNGVEAPQCP